MFALGGLAASNKQRTYPGGQVSHYSQNQANYGRNPLDLNGDGYVDMKGKVI